MLLFRQFLNLKLRKNRSIILSYPPAKGRSNIKVMEIYQHPVWNNLKAYKKPAHLARFFLARNLAKLYPRSSFIGITGSVGKTTTKETCLSVLAEKFKVVATRENFDPIFNIPATILRMRPNTQKAILEMGIEYPGEMNFYLSLVKPATAVVTRISFAHSQFLGDINQILEEKGKLIRQLPKDGFAILNWDDLNVRKLAKDTEAKVIFFGTDPQSCNFWASNIRLENGLTRFELNYGVERVEIFLNLLGKHFVYSALAAAALGVSLGMNLINIKKGLEKVASAPHRLQLLEGLNGCYVLDDTYNSSPVALEEALNVLNELSARRRIAVLGEMRELGVYSEQLHREIARKIYKDKIDYVFLGGGDVRFIGDELIKLGYLPEKIEVNLSNSQIVARILRTASKGDLILIKGSRAVKLDEVVARISKSK
ncbi:MAG: UDP-N-acetylmuramoyl-tripeptide-D-alanyl-D-alanine ligase [Candidatus Daviesbacteria bacterium GW2011_GWA1_41_61]|uniref:UDP-N-acetylmuramoyl-tripeptide--D-alanyl-D-alanine ligase n=1 Tax=Candidatus Daviesbacteria bacterium GW2011_GWA2_40_9 TaxID=1618424 RepID=A0A0G0WFA7_9BACT|nr:MAG: UDP-N-acetylmuramoyl-tripeptide-D-alanyl-D-alanine ligase [Candidatus Daviesbacteria bacterium GW2011_GWC1_40_9]KKR82980.1 MAG: UDP-N-acetylmuramoyl-tripeptide-D-alanyl-D-alanine ligase [Candidatus Daviesbacteria bacterium GW2011_GWA2_40_9]KKR92906.1 MAG: UDP-N-acetylmuramoyl-tripeptide-D-alanyl-D-alanine ligase [Candidatus Daviesbacteria bacterium GW2011_GWB1_41_15]KKS15450.1 MAG: UDP-N-acetylmuramoyl-tripeptide-D-alanyl-D-alanine ligase [Candidatus Daviesbacteria bacterium GW2011_GWA1_